MQRVDEKTVRVETRGKTQPDFEIKFLNACYGLQYGDPLVFTTLQSTQQCISPLDHIQVPNRGPCLIESIKPIAEKPKPSA